MIRLVEHRETAMKTFGSRFMSRLICKTRGREKIRDRILADFALSRIQNANSAQNSASFGLNHIFITDTYAVFGFGFLLNALPLSLIPSNALMPFDLSNRINAYTLGKARTCHLSITQILFLEQLYDYM